MPIDPVTLARVLSSVDRRALRRLLDAQVLRQSLPHYMRWAWQVMHAYPLEWNWHLDAKCEHLAACRTGQIRRLIINEPPRHLKSWTTSVAFPSWWWASDPTIQFLVASADRDVVTRDADAMRDLCSSDEYRSTFRIDWGFKSAAGSKQEAKGYYRNSRGGHRISKAMGQKAQGVDADVIIFDDPLEASDAYGDKAALIEHGIQAKQKFMTRLNDERTGIVILIMQRLHDLDLTGLFLEDGGWTHLYMPSEFETARRCRTWIGWSDPRSEEGELLFPARQPREILDAKKIDLGSRGYAGQYQQRPVAAHGAMVQKSWLEFWSPETLPAKMDLLLGSWDCTFLKSDDSDYVVGQTWGLHDGKIYLLDQTRHKMNVPDMLVAIRAQHAAWPNMFAIVIEERAAGKHVMNTLSREIYGIEGFNPQGMSKEERLASVLTYFEQHRIYLPDWERCSTIDTDYSWVRDRYIPELTSFPASRHDDQVDATAQALIWIQNNGPGNIVAKQLG